MQLQTLGRWRWRPSWGSNWSREGAEQHKLAHVQRCALRIDRNGFDLDVSDAGVGVDQKDSDSSLIADADVDKATMFVVCKGPY
jgi:hypothetical protein